VYLALYARRAWAIFDHPYNAAYLLASLYVRARFPTLRTATYGYPGFPVLAGSWVTIDRPLGPWMAYGWRGVRTFAAILPDPMYPITCPSRTRLHARSQVLATHRSLMYRVIGHIQAHLDAWAPSQYTKRATRVSGRGRRIAATCIS